MQSNEAEEWHVYPSMIFASLVPLIHLQYELCNIVIAVYEHAEAGSSLLFSKKISIQPNKYDE